MLSAIFWFFLGVLVAAIVGFFVWKNNQNKWKFIVEKAVVFTEQYDSVDELKTALKGLFGK
jgi:hypothetical protein